MYIDDGVAAPDGREFTVAAWPTAARGPGWARRPFVVFFNSAQGLDEWNVRVDPWPKRRHGPVGWSTTRATFDDAEALCDRLKALIEAGKWTPDDGPPLFGDPSPRAHPDDWLAPRPPLGVSRGPGIPLAAFAGIRPVSLPVFLLLIAIAFAAGGNIGVAVVVLVVALVAGLVVVARKRDS